MIIPIVLAGGSGIRLWPLSRRNYPKSLLKFNRFTSLQATLKRIHAISDIVSPLIVCNHQYASLVLEQAQEVVKKSTILVENAVLNTAPAVAIAALYALKQNRNPLLLVLPTDHYIPEIPQVTKTIEQAVAVASAGKLVTFGITPSSPNPNYGYMKRGDPLPKKEGYILERFIEKPKVNIAQAYVDSGDYYWNSGIFLVPAVTLIQELEKYAPAVLNAAKHAVEQLQVRNGFIYLDKDSMKTSPVISLDNAVLEKTRQGVVFPFMGRWYDLGDWESLYAVEKKNKDNNVINENVVTFNTKNSYLYSSKPLLVTSGIDNCLVIATPDAILVARRDQKQDIKHIVDYLLKKHRAVTRYPIGYRSWGHFVITEKSESYRIRHLYIKPKKTIIAKGKMGCVKHWVIIKGMGQMISAEGDQEVSENEAFNIFDNTLFRLMNVSKIPMHIIEIKYF